MSEVKIQWKNITIVDDGDLKFQPMNDGDKILDSKGIRLSFLSNEVQEFKSRFNIKRLRGADLRPIESYLKNFSKAKEAMNRGDIAEAKDSLAEAQLTAKLWGFEHNEDYAQKLLNKEETQQSLTGKTPRATENPAASGNKKTTTDYQIPSKWFEDHPLAKKFKKDNPVHQLLFLESELFSSEEIDSAYDKLFQVKEAYRLSAYQPTEPDSKLFHLKRIINDQYESPTFKAHGTLVTSYKLGSSPTYALDWIMVIIAKELNWDLLIYREPEIDNYFRNTISHGLFWENHPPLGSEYEYDFYMKEFSSSIKNEIWLKPLSKPNKWKSDFLVIRGYEYFQRGKLKESARDFEEAFHLDPKNAQAAWSTAFAYEKMGDNGSKAPMSKAITAYKKALELEKNIDELWFATAECYIKAGEVGEAAEAYEQAIEKSHFFKTEYHDKLFDTYLALGKKNNALGVLEKIKAHAEEQLNYRPSYFGDIPYMPPVLTAAILFEGLSKSYLKLGKPNESKAVQLKAADSYYLASKEFPKTSELAKEYLKKAHSLNPKKY